ncbi:polynucleotide adenylyltransferase [Halomonas elongata]|uniref:CCA-adding enzyme n=2 Tax=Halomonas elongata TaxID=2746 RepID=E1V6Y3_HALED|nr:polynucleotide adenylyltransferase [Halomonas elongata]MBW5799552.1 polynucleotide adenylyltransferase [Halomonas elongata]OBX34160.1 multifunctional CCA protein [Halomonas elongata]WBF17111.1 polynucleotide adenylyltransferase [Halomonas elongata]WPU45945.1 polynucleotide adenylyltransferase [Halomonas elongata DSM 2581]WVI70765.1 polynucleotide adenylyltransferase [Halomonas elongata]
MSTELDRRLAGLDVYRVGGAVRDALLGWPVTDVDWVVVGATPDAMQQRGFKPVGRDFPVFLHPDSHEEFALARTERKSGHGYTGFEIHASPSVTLEEDLARRDLTINAMAETPSGELVDPFGGRADLEARVLRHVSPAFIEDPLRVLRVARFLARYAGLGFVIAEETLTLMRRLVTSGEIAHLVAERVWTETEKALGEPWPDVYFQTLDDCGALAALMPELVEDAAQLDEALGRLQRLPEDIDSRDAAFWRWARLVEHLTPEQRRRLTERLRLPKAVSRLADQAAHTHRLVHETGVVDGERVMAWLEGIDAWRRSERVPSLIALVSLDDAGLAEDLALAWRLATQILPKSLVDEGYKGRALGEELARRRREAIDGVMETER